MCFELANMFNFFFIYNLTYLSFYFINRSLHEFGSLFGQRFLEVYLEDFFIWKARSPKSLFNLYEFSSLKSTCNSKKETFCPDLYSSAYYIGEYLILSIVNTDFLKFYIEPYYSTHLIVYRKFTNQDLYLELVRWLKNKLQLWINW